MDNDLEELEHVLQDRAAEVPFVADVPTTMLARARRRIARNAVSTVAAVGLLVVGASAGLAGMGLLGAPAKVPSTSPSVAAPSDACLAADLQAAPALDGAAGSVVGSIRFTNAGASTCTLQGRPTIALFGSGDVGGPVPVRRRRRAVGRGRRSTHPTGGRSWVSLPARSPRSGSGGPTRAPSSPTGSCGGWTSAKAEGRWTSPARKPPHLLPATGRPNLPRSRSGRSSPARAPEKGVMMRRIHTSLVAGFLTATIVLAAVPAVFGMLEASAAVAPCHREQLGVRSDGIDGAAGTIHGAWVFTNRSNETCSLKGYADLQMYGHGGRPLPTTVKRSLPPGPSLVMLVPGDSATFFTSYSDVGSSRCAISAVLEIRRPTPPPRCSSPPNCRPAAAS